MVGRDAATAGRLPERTGGETHTRHRVEGGGCQWQLVGGWVVVAAAGGVSVFGGAVEG